MPDTKRQYLPKTVLTSCFLRSMIKKSLLRQWQLPKGDFLVIEGSLKTEQCLEERVGCLMTTNQKILKESRGKTLSILLESLILAQDERWRRASHMQVERY